MALTYTQIYRIGQTRSIHNQQIHFHALLFIQIELWKNWEKSKTILQYQKVIQIYIKRGFIILRKLVSAFRPHQYTNDMKKLYEKMKLSMYYYKKESLKCPFSHFTFHFHKWSLPCTSDMACSVCCRILLCAQSSMRGYLLQASPSLPHIWNILEQHI